MRITTDSETLMLWASANDTYEWAHKPGGAWPCSTLSGSRFFATFDSNGLCELTVNGREATDIDGHEFSVCAADLLAAKVRKDHPAYFVAVGQFI